MKNFFQKDENDYPIFFWLTGFLLILVLQFSVLPANACTKERIAFQICLCSNNTTVAESFTDPLPDNLTSHQANNDDNIVPSNRIVPNTSDISNYDKYLDVHSVDMNGESAYLDSAVSGTNQNHDEGLTFSAVVEKNRVLATWIADPLQNNGFFVVERSLDAIFFEPIGVVPGNGISNTTQEYTLLDVYPFNGLSYYRLKYASPDGSSSEYSQMVEVNFTRSGVNHLPNSNNSIITLEITDSEGNLANVRAFNSDARLVYEDQFLVESNRYELKVDLTGYPPGRYSIICSMGNLSLKRTLVIQ
jgi:hypothetical protein